MSSVAIHPPKTPATKGSRGIAKATLPNVCKMPGPPAPFVPSPLPNIAKSGMSPKGYSKKVKIEGNAVAIRGASFKSMGDVASKGTGGGLISANTHGPAKFITPGSLTVKIEGKSVHLLGEPMLNNCGPSGSPPNTGATMMGLDQDTLQGEDLRKELCRIIKECDAQKNADARNAGGNPGSGEWCKKNAAQLGTDKHECAKEKINEQKDKGVIGSDVQAEQYHNFKKGNSSGTICPDVMVGQPPSCSAVYDFKTSCPSPTSKPPDETVDIWPTYRFDKRNKARWPKSFRPASKWHIYHNSKQDYIYGDVCGAWPQALHPQGNNCADA